MYSGASRVEQQAHNTERQRGTYIDAKRARASSGVKTRGSTDGCGGDEETRHDETRQREGMHPHPHRHWVGEMQHRVVTETN